MKSLIEVSSVENYTHASAIAFNALLSFFPFVILVLLVCQKILRWQDGYEMILKLLKDYYLPTGSDFITRNLRIVVANNKAAALSLISLVFTSAGMFTPIELALNRAWQVENQRAFWKSQLLAIVLVLACAIIVLAPIYLAVQTEQLLVATVAKWKKLFKIVFTIAVKMLTLPPTIMIFFLVYYLLPNRRVPLLRVLSTAVFVGIVWEILKMAFTRALPLLDLPKIYGPFAISVALVTWAFLSAIVLLFGAILSARWPESK
ncbi:MAG: YihY/virulence factor BrkB family protein [Acidobacteriota bacterium]|nr:YihY/virulence factor BrkB family protein [Blastocatellia bacterium]MDW8413083.1 YihY/virulence factor BrkB family protein [Acidobacteriota bacterium]